LDLMILEVFSNLNDSIVSMTSTDETVLFASGSLYYA